MIVPEGFAVSACWYNTGTAGLYIAHTLCGWLHVLAEDESDVPLGDIAGIALRHEGECEAIR